MQQVSTQGGLARLPSGHFVDISMYLPRGGSNLTHKNTHLRER